MNLISRIIKQKSFVTGVDCFVGDYLAETLIEYGTNIYTLVRAMSGELINIQLIIGLQQPVEWVINESEYV